MAEFPALPFWTDAYLGDTTHLNTTEHGAYLLLLITAWRTSDCALPDDDKLLARYARCDTRQWKKLRPIIEPFFTIRGGKWRQGKLTDVRQALSEKREKAAANGRASALKRQGRHSTKREQSDTQATNEASTERELTKTITSKEEESLPLVPSPARAADCFNEVCLAADWTARTDAQRVEGLSIVDGWLASGFDLNLDILAGIKAARSRKPERTRSLKRFTSTIRGKHTDRQGVRCNGETGDLHRQQQARDLVADLAGHLSVGAER